MLDENSPDHSLVRNFDEKVEKPESIKTQPQVLSNDALEETILETVDH